MTDVRRQPMRATDADRAAVCSACESDSTEPFYSLTRIPTQSCVLLGTRTEAVDYPVGDLTLAVCHDCGFIQNIDFDPGKVDYSLPTEESQAFSPRFQEFAGSLAKDLVSRHRLIGRSVLEIGCGKGDFLRLLIEEGVARGLGIDPGFRPDRFVGASGSAEFIRDWYGDRYLHLTADLVLTRHLLEHVPNVAEFLGWLAMSTARTPHAVLFNEIPDVARILKEGAFWDIYYEHCSYFTPGSLARAVRRTGMRLERLALGFDDQYILAESVPGTDDRLFPLEEGVGEVLDWVNIFTSKVEGVRSYWQETIAGALDSGRRVCLWGGGSKTIGFLSALGLAGEHPGLLVVDINVHKHGKWLPGVVAQITPPGALRQAPPDLVVPMNPIYVEEIRADLETMGLRPEIRPV